MSEQSPGGRRVDASMTLLTSMLERPLDPGYAAAARSRTEAGLPAATPLTSPLVIGFSLVLGLSLGLASAVLRGNETTTGKARAALIEQIEDRRAGVEELAARAGVLQDEVLRLEGAQLAATTQGRADELQTLSQVAGAVALSGPGLVITLDDNPNAQGRTADSDPRTNTTAQDVVMARDIQVIANYLWRSGAEAVAVNGRRLTSRSAIRFAGEAILVDYRPLTRPYVVSAIGPPGTFPSRFAAGPGGTYLASLRSTYGIVVDTSVRDAVSVPAAPPIQLRYARPAGDGAGSTAADPAPSPSLARSTPSTSSVLGPQSPAPGGSP